MNTQEIYKIVTDIKTKQNEYKEFIIPIFDDQNNSVGYLKPITIEQLENGDVIYMLTKWRKMFMKFFLTQFSPSTERTRNWLTKVVLPSQDRILFLIYTMENKIVGNFGVCNFSSESAELDNLIRGEKGGVPQLIYYSEISLLKWLFLELNMSNVFLHVFSNNSKTIALHEKVGFEVIQESTLWKQRTDDELIYSISEKIGDAVDFSYLKMNLLKEKFITQYC